MPYKSRPLAAGWNRPILGSHHRLGRQHIARPEINPQAALPSVVFAGILGLINGLRDPPVATVSV